MSAFKQPYFDRSVKYDAEKRFSKHVMQKYIALFLSKPEWYHSIHALGECEREGYFFYQFLKFVNPYINLTLDKDYDTICYFGSLHIEKSGTTNVCGGGGPISHSARKQFMDRHRRSVDETRQRGAYLLEKYGLQSDARTFLGHTQIWKNPSPELLKLENWECVMHQAYSDETVELPDILDIDLVPLAIRNKTYQRWKNRNQRARSAMAVAAVAEEEEDTPPTQPTAEKPAGIDKSMVVITPEMEALMDFDW